jgi:2-methylisocitrate lyase-like PEP mutase family enzyme
MFVQIIVNGLILAGSYALIAGFPEAMRRARAYFDVGADALFVEAPRSREELVEIGRSLPEIKIANIVEGGHTPIVSAKELSAMGFKLAVYANLVRRSSVKAVQSSLNHLRMNGDSSDILDHMITMEERGRVTQKDLLDSIEKSFVYNAA